MITFLHGKLVEALPTQVTVDVNGVGYEALIPLSSYDKLPAPGQEVKLLTHLVVREDAHTLYGFMSTAERDLFRLLINTVSGIGPKIALNVLSGISVTAFRGAVANGDVKALSQISGVGRKTAERIVDWRTRISADLASASSGRDRPVGLDLERQLVVVGHLADARVLDPVVDLPDRREDRVDRDDADRQALGALGGQVADAALDGEVHLDRHVVRCRAS